MNLTFQRVLRNVRTRRMPKTEAQKIAQEAETKGWRVVALRTHGHGIWVVDLVDPVTGLVRTVDSIEQWAAILRNEHPADL